MVKKYANNTISKEHSARAYGVLLPISAKQAVEICSLLRNKKLETAKNILQDVISLRKAVPYKRFKKNIPHKRSIGPGRFPVNASKYILKLLEQLESNAQLKGLNTSNLVISHICAHKGSNTFHFGRLTRRKMKRTHVEVIAEEKATKKK